MKNPWGHILALTLLLCISSPVCAQQSEETPPGRLLWHPSPDDELRAFTIEWEKMPAYSPDFCPIPIEGVVVSGEHGGKLLESDLFSSGFSFDLNNDGDVDDSFPLDVFQNGNWSRQKLPNRQTVRPPLQVTAFGPKFVLYYHNETEASIGLPFGSRILGLLSGPNPCLQVMLFEPVDGPGEEGRLTLKGGGNQVQTWAHESGLLHKEHRWYHIQWSVVDPNNPGDFQIRGPKDTPALLLLRANYSPVEGVRVRGLPLLEKLGGV